MFGINFHRSGGDGVSSTSGMVHLIFRMVARILQFVLSLTAIGLYASELKANDYSVRYEYAVVVGVLSAITSMVYLIPQVKSFLAFAWDFLLFIFWIGVFGSMGRYFINPKSKTSAHDQKQRHAVWVDAVLMILWFITFCAGGFVFFRHRRAKSVSGAAHV